MTTYIVPRGDRTTSEYYDYVGSLPWAWAGQPAFSIDPSHCTVTVDATITGFDEIVLPAPPAAPPTPITKLAFLDRFTDVELATILTMAKTVIQVEVFVKKLDAATDVVLSDPRTVSGVQALETFGMIGAGRASQILGA